MREYTLAELQNGWIVYSAKTVKSLYCKDLDEALAKLRLLAEDEK